VLKIINQRKHAKLQWLQNPIQTNGYNLNNEIYKTSITFKHKKEGIP